MYGLKALLDAIGAGGTAGTPDGPIQTVQGVDGGEPIAITSAPHSSVVTFTRTADSAAYLANDVLGANNGGSPGAAALTFLGLGNLDGGDVLITSSFLRLDTNAVPVGMTSFKLAFYSVTPPSALVDNNPHDIPSGDRASFLGFLDLGTPVDCGATLYVNSNAQNMQITVPEGGSVFAYLITNGGCTIPSGTVVTVGLKSLEV